jgi:hypothetical protein
LEGGLSLLICYFAIGSRRPHSSLRVVAASAIKLQLAHLALLHAEGSQFEKSVAVSDLN